MGGWLSSTASLLSSGSLSDSADSSSSSAFSSSHSVPPGSALPSSASLPSLLRRLRSGRQLSRVRERLLDVLALHQPLDGLSQYAAATPAESQRAHSSPGTDSSGDARARDERKEKSRWDDEHAQPSEDDMDEAAAEEVAGGSGGGGIGVGSGMGTAASECLPASADSVLSEAEQHSAHRARGLLLTSWSAVCGSSAVLSVWDDCFASSFHTRCAELVHASFARFKFHDTIERALEQWKDGGAEQANDDGASGAAAASGVAGGGCSSVTVSSMWSGYRQPAVAALVSSFAAQLERLAADIRYLLHCSLADTVKQATAQQANGAALSASASASSLHSPALLYPFDYLSFLSLPRYLDDELSPSLHRLYTNSVHSMAEQLKRRLAALDHSVLSLMASESSWRSDECRRLVERAVFIGRCCASIEQQTAVASFSQALQQQPPGSVTQSAYQPGTSYPPTSASALSSSPILAALSSTARSAFRIWSRFVAATVSDELESSLAAWRSSSSSSSSSRAAHSSSQQRAGAVPTQPSAYVHRVLWSVQQHTYSTHGYQAPDEVLRWMMQDTAIALTAVIHAQLDVQQASSGAELDEEQHSAAAAGVQNLSAAPFAAAPLSALLQLYFDLLFLLSMVRLPSEAAGSSHSDASSGVLLLRHVESALAARLPAPEWPALRLSVVASCTAAMQRTQLLFGLLVKRNPLPPLPLSEQSGGIAAAGGQSSASGAAALSATSSASSGMPLAQSSSSRILTFSTSFYTHASSSSGHSRQAHSQQSAAAASGSPTSVVSRLSRPALSASLPVSVAVSSGASHASSVAANAASVASESAAMLKEKGRQLLGKWNLV